MTEQLEGWLLRVQALERHRWCPARGPPSVARGTESSSLGFEGIAFAPTRTLLAPTHGEPQPVTTATRPCPLGRFRTQR
jgi:hypothetical protein